MLLAHSWLLWAFEGWTSIGKTFSLSRVCVSVCLCVVVTCLWSRWKQKHFFECQHSTRSWKWWKCLPFTNSELIPPQLWKSITDPVIKLDHCCGIAPFVVPASQRYQVPGTLLPIKLPATVPAKTNCSDYCTHVENPEEAQGTWLQTGSALIIEAILEVNQQMEDRSLSL